LSVVRWAVGSVGNSVGSTVAALVVQMAGPMVAYSVETWVLQMVASRVDRRVALTVDS